MLRVLREVEHEPVALIVVPGVFVIEPGEGRNTRAGRPQPRTLNGPKEKNLPNPRTPPMTPSTDVHAPYVQELVAKQDWAGLVRYWLAHQRHSPALDAAIELVRGQEQLAAFLVAV